MARAIIFNGTSQQAQVTLPISSPWTALGAFKIVYRLRTMGTNNGVVCLLAQPDQSPIIRVDHTSTRIDLTDNRGAVARTHTPNNVSDVIMKVQFDPSNSRWTVESWTGSGSGYVVGTTTNPDNSDWDFSGWTFNIAANAFATAREAFHLDWIYLQEGADALSPIFPGSEPPAGTYLLKYLFNSDNGNDTSGNGLTLTLTGTPTFEDTPALPPVAPSNLQLSTPVADTVRLHWWDKSGNETSFRIERADWLTPEIDDPLIDTDGTELSLHLTEPWVQPTWANVGKCYIHSNRITKDSSASAAVYYVNETLNDDQVVEGRFRILSAISVNVTLSARIQTGVETDYRLRHNISDNKWTLRKTVAGSPTELDDWTEALVAGDERDVRLEVVGTQIRGYINDILRLQATDSSISGGKAGFRFAGAASSSTGYAIGNFRAYSYQDWVEIGSVGGNVDVYDDTTVSPDSTYIYQVKARNDTGDSDYAVRQFIKTPASGKYPLRVASVNLFFNTGTDNVHNIDRTAEWLSHYNADIIGCCEAPATDVSALVSALETKTGVEWYSFHVGKTLGLDEGNLILSQYPFVDTDELYMTNSRSAAQATVVIHGRTINFFATHLKNGQDETNAAIRQDQLDELLPWIAGFGEIKILVGDINATPSSVEVSTMIESDFDSSWAVALASSNSYAYAANPPTTTTRTRTVHIDYVFLSENASNITIRQAQIVDTRDLSNTAVTEIIGTADDAGVRPSDHNPVLADFDLIGLVDVNSPPLLFRGRNFMLFDDDEVNRFEFWPATTGDTLAPTVIFVFGGR